MIMEVDGAVETQQIISDYTVTVNRSGVLNPLGDDLTGGRCQESVVVRNPRTFDLGRLQKVKGYAWQDLTHSSCKNKWKSNCTDHPDCRNKASQRLISK